MADTLESLEIEVKHSASGAAGEISSVTNALHGLGNQLKKVLPDLDVLYMTRVQKERFLSEEEYIRLRDSYILTKAKLKNAKEDLSILHPLPRVNEIHTSVDADPRACYFRQVLNGKFIRMALILKLLEVE